MDLGLHQGLDYSTYYSLDAVNKSVLEHFGRSAAHAYHYMLEPREDTDALLIGHATHAAILEPDLFESDYIAAPKVDRRTKKGKAEWSAFVDRAGGRIHLRREQYELCMKMRDSVWANPTAAEILRGARAKEVVALWRDEETELLCKSRMDALSVWMGWTCVVDVKTCQNAGVRAFERQVANYGFHQQDAWYLDGLDALQPAPRRFLFLAVEKDPPHCSAVYELDEYSREQGRAENREHLLAYKRAVESGQWPGYPAGVRGIALPPWARRPEEVM